MASLTPVKDPDVPNIDSSHMLMGTTEFVLDGIKEPVTITIHDEYKVFGKIEILPHARTRVELTHEALFGLFSVNVIIRHGDEATTVEKFKVSECVYACSNVSVPVNFLLL
jgi:hypothetical protein